MLHPVSGNPGPPSAAPTPWAGTSTTVVYSLFGGKEGLQRAVIRQGFDDFAAAQAAGPVTDHAVTDIAGLGMIFIEWALDHPRLYAEMFDE